MTRAFCDSLRSHPQLWSRVSAATRTFWYDLLTNGVGILPDIEEFFSLEPNDSGFTPLLVGAPLKNLSAALEGKPDRALRLLSNATNLLGPAQLQLLGEMVEWDPRAREHRESVRRYLDPAAANLTLDNVDPSPDLSLPFMLRIAGLKKGLHHLDRHHAALTTATTLEKHLDKAATTRGLNAFCSEAMTVGQKRAALGRLLDLDEKLSMTEVSSCYVPAIPTLSMQDFRADGIRKPFVDDALKVFNKLLHSQKLAIYMLIKDVSEDFRAELSDYAERTPGILQFVSEDALTRSAEVGTTESPIVSDELLGSGLARDLPAATKYALLKLHMADEANVRYEDFEEKKLTQILDCLDCELLSRVRESDLLEVLSRHKVLFSHSGPWNVYPRDFIECAAERVVKAGLVPGENDTQGEDWAHAIGGPILNVLIGNLGGDDGIAQALEQIGRLSMPQIVATMSRRRYQELAALADRHLASTFVTDTTLYRMGSLAFASNKVAIGKADVGTFVKTLATGEHRLVCLDWRARWRWSRMLQSAFGPVSGWDEQVLLQLGDLLAVLTPAETQRVNTTALARILPHLLEESRLTKHYETPVGGTAGTAMTRYTDVCAHWLGDVEGPNYLSAVRKLHRLYLAAAEKAVADARPAAPVLSRVRRQAANDEAGREAEMFFSKVSAVLVQMAKRQLLDSDTQTKVEEAIETVKKTAAEYIKKKLNLEETPDYRQLSEELTELAASGDYPADDPRMLDVDRHMIETGRHMALQVAEIIKLRPIDLGIAQDDFCDFFKRICLDPDFVGDESVIFRRDRKPLSSRFTCDGVRAAGSAAVGLAADDLESWDEEELWACLETLGNIDWPLRTKIDVWKLLDEKVGDQMKGRGDLVVPRYSVQLGNLLEAAALEAPESLNLSIANLDTLSILGRFAYPEDVTEALARQIADDTKSQTGSEFPYPGEANRTELNLLAFGGMGTLACGFEQARELEGDDAALVETALERCAEAARLAASNGGERGGGGGEGGRPEPTGSGGGSGAAAVAGGASAAVVMAAACVAGLLATLRLRAES